MISRLKFILFSTCLVQFGAASGQALKIKNAFGNNGFVKNNIGTDGSDYIYSTAVQSDGKIVIGGNFIYRINEEGVIDPTFGNNGFIDNAYAGGTNNVAVQNDGKILYSLSNHEDSIALRRVTNTGTPDSSFNGDGELLIGQENSKIYTSSIKVQADGRILVTALAQEFLPVFKNKIFVARFLPNGLPDNSFDTDGKILLELSYSDEVFDIAEQSDGKLIVTGIMHPDVDPNSSGTLYVIRLLANGTRDMTFNGTGIIGYNQPNSGGEAGRLLEIYGNNKILVGGQSNGQLLLIRLNANGSYDNSFNTDGIVTASNGLFNYPSKIHLLAGNKILVTGSTAFYPSTTGNDFAAFKFDDAGNSDILFNGSGKTHLARQGNDHVAGSSILPDGKIMLIGYRDSIPVLTLAKILPTGIFDEAYGGNGFKYSIFNRSDEFVRKLMLQQDGKIVMLVGKNPGVLNPAQGVLVRYNVDGNPDNSFGAAGIRFLDSATAGSSYLSAILQAGGKLISACLAGTPAATDQTRIILTRYNINGSVDNTFDASAFANLSSGFHTGLDIASDNSGNIFILFSMYDQNNDHFIYKLQPNGQPDLSYGTMGKVVLSELQHPGLFAWLTIQQNGQLLIPGFTYTVDKTNYYILRLNIDGEIDYGFANNGIYSNPQNEADESGLFGLAVTPDNKIIIGGSSYQNDDQLQQTKIERLLVNGSPDLSFNGTGSKSLTYLSIANPDAYAYPAALALHPDSSIYVVSNYDDDDDDNDPAGTDYNLVIRLKNNGTIDSALSVDGTGWYTIMSDGLYDLSTGIHISPDSSIYITGAEIGSLSDYDYNLRAFKRLPSDQGRVYTFIGTGNWNSAANWRGNAVPPQPLPNGSVIVIDPVAGGTSILNVPQSINAGGSINIKTGSKLVIQGTLNIAN